jgi:hypothetical protein
MAAVPDPFRPAVRRRVRRDQNEDELGKALPETEPPVQWRLWCVPGSTAFEFLDSGA